jgi:hypothetical protein
MRKKNNKTSTELLLMEQCPSSNVEFKIGDVVRSYRCAFSEQHSYKNAFLQGVIIGIESWVSSNDWLKVKWQIEYSFGKTYDYVNPIKKGDNVFMIYVESPHLIKVNTAQLSLAL